MPKQNQRRVLAKQYAAAAAAAHAAECEMRTANEIVQQKIARSRAACDKWQTAVAKEKEAASALFEELRKWNTLVQAIPQD